MKMEQDSILGCRLLCNSDCRPYDAYAISSNNTFEFARFERQYRCTILCANRPELHVYRTQYKYQELNDHFTEVFIGKIVADLTLPFAGRSMRVYETTGSQDGSEMNWKYEIRQSFLECFKDFFFVPLPVGPCESQTWKIITKQKATSGPSFREEVDLF